LGKRGEGDTSARFDIAEGVLLRNANVAAKLDQLPPMNVMGVVDELEDVCDAVLRIVALVAER
jgi:hypothetical protein